MQNLSFKIVLIPFIIILSGCGQRYFHDETGKVGYDGPIPSEIRLMGPPEVTTSDCVGNPKTALCALETYRACLIRRDDSLCKIIGFKGFGYKGEPRKGSYDPDRYIIHDIEFFDHDNIPPNFLNPYDRSLKLTMSELDAAIIITLFDPKTKEYNPERTALWTCHLVRSKKINKWQVTDWYSLDVQEPNSDG